MKKLLSILGTISLITSGSSNLIACDNNIELTSEELEKLKKEKSKTINSNKLEWMHPQESPFSTVDNKCYVAIWRGDKNDDWRIVKFKHSNGQKVVDKYDKYKLISSNDEKDLFNLFILKGFASYFWLKKDDGTRFKLVYRWDGIDDSKTPNINSKTGEIKD